MNTAQTISVNPVSKTLGALNPEATVRFLQQHARKVDVFKNQKPLTMSSFLFACSAPTSYSYGGAILLLRVLFSALLIVSGGFILAGEISSPINFIEAEYFALGEIFAGALLAFGLLSRPAMLIASAIFGISVFNSIMAGIFDMQSLLSLLGSVFFLVMGAGRYSTDFLIRKAMVLRKRENQRKIREQRLSYRAYRLQHM